jgi:hypothetical protein
MKLTSGARESRTTNRAIHRLVERLVSQWRFSMDNIDINNPDAISALTADVTLWPSTSLHQGQLDQSEIQVMLSKEDN